MPLPQADSLLASVDALERALAAQDLAFAADLFARSSPGAEVKAVANGMVELVSLSISPLSVDALSSAAVAALVRAACADALAAARAATAGRAAAAAPGHALAGLPAAGAPAPTDAAFDVAVGRLLAPADAIDAALRARTFSGEAAGIRAVVNGALDLLTLTYPDPVPNDAMVVEDATAAAINEALDKAKRLFGDTTARVVDAVTKATVPPGDGSDRRRRALFVVETPGSLRPADAALHARLVGQGFDVTVKAGAATRPADAEEQGIIVISESTLSADVREKFRTARVPILVLEPALWDDLRMTGATWQKDFGDAEEQTKLDVREAGHALAAGLSGEVAVTSRPEKFVWGAPASGARRIARLVGRADAWGIFAYRAGDAMVGMTAPARRVGFFAGRDAASAFTPEGWRLFDAAVRWLTAARAVFVVGAGAALRPADAALKGRLEEQHRLTVDVRPATDANTADLADAALLVISESAASADVRGRYKDVPIPIVDCEPATWDDMGMTGPTWQRDFGDLEGQTELAVTSTGHPLSAGLAGRVAVTTSPQKFLWGRPGPEAAKVAALGGRKDDWAIFAYEAGAAMIAGRAPAARVGFFAGRDTAAAFTPAGWALFDAAVRWARKPRALLVVGARPLRPADEALRTRLERVFGLAVEVRLATEVAAHHATGKRVVVVSESAFSGDVGGKLAAMAVPLVVLEPALWDDLKMTGGAWMKDIGDAHGQTQITMRKADHPLAAGLSGTVTVTAQPNKIVWGVPAPAAVKIASLAGRADASAVFGYERGATMVGLAAPARRVGWFAGRDTAAALTADGWRLFDAAVRWTAGPLDLFRDATDLVELVLTSAAAEAP